MFGQEDVADKQEVGWGKKAMETCKKGSCLLQNARRGKILPADSNYLIWNEGGKEEETNGGRS